MLSTRRQHGRQQLHRDRVSSKPDLAKIADCYHRHLLAHGIRSWVDFVASAANFADLPSRDEFALLESFGAIRVPFRFPAVFWLGKHPRYRVRVGFLPVAGACAPWTLRRRGVQSAWRRTVDSCE